MIEIPVSWGELLDKITILQIKRTRLTQPAAIANVERELAALAARAPTSPSPALAGLVETLSQVNTALWDIEDALRHHEQALDFGPEFVALARAVYHRNDARAALKRQISLLLGSELLEEKSYGAP